MILAFFLASAPFLFWEGAPPEKAPAAQKIYVPADQLAAWSSNGAKAEALDPKSLEKAATPGVKYRMNVASATTAPWVDSNVARFARKPDATYYYDLPEKAYALAAAEASARGVKAVMHVPPADLDGFEKVRAFVESLGPEPGPAMVNLSIEDDGSPQTLEVLNLLARRNLLFRVGPAPGAITVSKSEASSAEPYKAAQELRQKIGDDKRLLRIYGSEVVLGNLNGQGKKARLHLVNYGRNPVEGLMIRVLGEYRRGTPRVYGVDKPMFLSYEMNKGATEFMLSSLPVYAVIDLE